MMSSVLWTVDHTSSISCRYFPGFHTGANLYCLVTEVQGCEQLAYGCYTAVPERKSNPRPLGR